MGFQASVAQMRSASQTGHGQAREATARIPIGAVRARPSVAQAMRIVAACLVAFILIIGFVMASLGIGAEGQAGHGPDRPQLPVMPSPGSRPVSVLDVVAGEGIDVSAGGGR